MKPESIEKYQSELENLSKASEAGFKSTVENRNKLITYCRELESYIEELAKKIESMESCDSCSHSENHSYLRYSSYCEDCEHRKDPPEYWSHPPVNNYEYFKED